MSFTKRLLSGEFVVLAEMDTPKGVDVSELITNARRVKERVDAVIVPDMDNGVMRMSALGGGVLLRDQGVESLIHVYCRDRNRMALQGDLLAAHAMGLQNIVVVHGEEMDKGDHRDALPAGDLDEVELIAAIGSLQNGSDMAGFDLVGTPQFTLGATIAPFADDAGLEAEMTLAKKKIAAGASFVITPPVFDLERFAAFMEVAKGLNVPVIPTVFLLKSVAIARYMVRYEPGTFIPEETIKRIRTASDREQESLAIAGETAAALRDYAQGVKIQTLGWEHRLPEILDYAGM